ncbi:MAG: hypothetical protein ACFFAU_04690 [Candidatus Hodarchaeota archaeon]
MISSKIDLAKEKYVIYFAAMVTGILFLLSIKWTIQFKFEIVTTISLMVFILFYWYVIFFYNLGKTEKIFLITIQSFFLHIGIQLCYPSLYSLNYDVLLGQQATEVFLRNGWAPTKEAFNYTNATQYLYYPLLHFILAPISLLFGIPTTHKYFASFWSCLTIIGCFFLISRYFEEEIAIISVYLFSLSPWYLFFHSHTNHESFAFPILLFSIYFISKSEFSHKDFQFIFSQILLFLLVISHHFTSYLGLIILSSFSLVNFINNSDYKKWIFSDIILMSLILIWGIMPFNAIFKFHLSFIFTILQAILIELLIIPLFVLLLILPLLLYILKKINFTAIRKDVYYFMNKFSEMYFEKAVIYGTIFLILLIFFIPDLLYILGRTGTKPLWSSILSFISMMIFFCLSLLKLPKLQGKKDISFRLLASVSLVLTGIIFSIVNLFPTIFTNFDIKERFLTITFLFNSPFVALKINEINFGEIRNKRRILYLFIVIGTALQASPINIIYPEQDPITADDWRLNPEKWIEAANWLKENIDYTEYSKDNRYLISSYRGKTFIEGISYLPVDERFLGDYVENFETLPNRGFIYVLSEEMFNLPAFGKNFPLNHKLKDFLLNESEILFSNNDIQIFKY